MNRKEPTTIPNYLAVRIATHRNENILQLRLERRRRYRVYAAMVLVAGLGTALIMFLTRLNP